MSMKHFLTACVIPLLAPAVWATVDVIVHTPECVVFASDSRTTIGETSEVGTDTYEKIVQVSEYVIAQTAGTAYPGLKNLATTSLTALSSLTTRCRWEAAWWRQSCI